MARPRRGRWRKRSPPARAYARAMETKHKSRRRRWLIITAALLLEPVAMKLRGYRRDGNLVVRCRKGHLFTTTWIPRASLKAIRYGWWRLQRCPVGKRWSVVNPVKENELSE